jgi:class 3 adenylate cyclase
MALCGAPLAHEDHAVRACYAVLAMQEAMCRYTEELRGTQGLEVLLRVGLHSGEVMDYAAVGQTTHLAARMEQLAPPGSIRLTADTLQARAHLSLGQAYHETIATMLVWSSSYTIANSG